MNPFRTAAFRVLAIGLALPLAALFWTVGCDVDSTDSTTGVLSDDGGILSFAGLYMNANNSDSNVYPLVFPEGKQSGTVLTWLRILQYGSVLEAYDNAGLTWTGSVSFNSGTATFSLKGRTTAGQSVEIFGTLVGGATNTSEPQATMDASWIEPNFYGNIRAKASVAPVATNSPTTNITSSVRINPRPAITLSAGNLSTNFSATGGSGNYTWSVDNNRGTINNTTGSSVTYTATGVSGSNTIRVRDTENSSNTDSCNIVI